jgi:hypothetical protein
MKCKESERLLEVSSKLVSGFLVPTFHLMKPAG